MQKIKQSKAKQGYWDWSAGRARLSKSEDLDLIPSFHVVERENQLLKISYTHIHTHTYMHIHVYVYVYISMYIYTHIFK